MATAVGDDLVAAVSAVCPFVSKQRIRRILAATGDPAVAINRLLDGTVAARAGPTAVREPPVAPRIDVAASSLSSLHTAPSDSMMEVSVVEQEAIANRFSTRECTSVDDMYDEAVSSAIESMSAAGPRALIVDLSSPPGTPRQTPRELHAGSYTDCGQATSAATLESSSPQDDAPLSRAAPLPEECTHDSPTLAGKPSSCSVDEVRREGLATADAVAMQHAQSFAARADKPVVDAPRKFWGCLRAPTARDLAIRRGPGSALQPPAYEHLVVLDFEWTADNRKAMLPISEITQFPSVLVRLSGPTSCIIDEFNSYVRPTLNPKLTDFSINLTGITQDMVDAAPTIEDTLPAYLAWLQSHGLVEGGSGSRNGRWAICTWSDADVGGQLVRELRHKGLAMPPCFDQWVDLKVLYKRHYKVEPRGGLQHCVERLGLKFDGRAHDGLVDSRNTAAIVLHMARGSMMHGAFVFRRCTRGLDQDGNPYGSRASQEAKKRRLAEGAAKVVGNQSGSTEEQDA